MEDILLFKSFAKGSVDIKSLSETNCVIYTRVSTKEQADTNQSLDTQKKACDEYARKHNYNIMAYFGGTYESAKTDERKQFTEMISFVKKSHDKISYILVYSLERFSRNDNSIWLSGQLRKLGIEIISVTQPIDTANPSGQLQQKLLFLFGEFDNQIRKQKCMDGMKEMLLRGEWPTMPPLGFDIVRINNQRKIIVNEKGKLIRKAFHWKMEGFTNEAIRQRLAQYGLKVRHQHITDIFRNPFYCGLMTHNMLAGKIIPGNQELLIPKEIFLKVNGILNTRAHGYKLNEENEAIPLKRFLHCDSCSKPMRGYMVKRKKIYYYKCSTPGCCNNKNANSLNKLFEKILSHFDLSTCDKLVPLLKKQMTATFNQLTKDKEDDSLQIKARHETLKQKIERLEERFIEEELNPELYKKYLNKYQSEKKEIELELMKATGKKLNLEECIDFTIHFALKAASLWRSDDYYIKQRIQNLVFPEGIRYNRKMDACRTSRINIFFYHIARLAQISGNKKSGKTELKFDFAAPVVWAGIEPATQGFSVLCSTD